ncbi:MAG: hypothetical protein HY833_00120 [Candidatus Aenigmarchaeota archaeon]|nr:hypothetical protein [Candidatus Aenigmarchaeota archaeon]
MVLGLDRKWGYAAVLVGYYFFVFIFSFRVAGFADYAGAAAVGVTSFVWFIFMATRSSILIADLKDLAIVLSIYYFIAFFVIFVDWQASNWFKTSYSWIKLIMSGASIAMWTGIWVDFYRQRVKGNI